ncbi:MAG TPA: hypothetical protein VGN86_00625 [Pyrinomonadaceae bacterium]|nr:hypothetical protein [Pyrinomonadaceae bacterium]
MRKTLIVAILCVAMLPTAAFAQTKKRVSSKRPRTTTAVEKASAAELEGATQIANQIKNLTKFIYLLGGIAKGLEQSDGAIRRKEASPALIESTEASKAKVRATFQDVRAGLDKLEIDFRANPQLQGYYYKLAGVADGAAKAEQLAAAGQFDQAGRSLLAVINRLTDVLVDMK